MNTPSSHLPRLLAALTLGLVSLTACGGDAAAASLALDEPLPTKIPPDTTLIIGDPQIKVALELSGQIDKLGFDVEWANISGGPQTSEAFRADSLDVGAVADIPPNHATWTGLPVKIVAAQYRADPVDHPIYQLGIAPDVTVESLEDLRGKKIAYSPGQAQGALVLRVLDEAGLSTDDVELIELPSTGDTYSKSLASGEVDVAPIGGTLTKRYLAEYESDGATVISHGLRDDPGHLYVRTETLKDAGKAAAIREYVRHWAKVVTWIYEHPKEWIKGYYVKDQGLTESDGEYLVEAAGKPEIPGDWSPAIERHRETIELLAKATGNPEFDAEDLYDRRYETIAAAALPGGDRS